MSVSMLFESAVDRLTSQIDHTFYKDHSWDEYLVWNYTEPPTVSPFWFEKCDLKSRIEWCIKYWTICLWSTGIYLVLIFLGQMWMKDRQPYKLRGLLTIWNFVLAIFSTIAFTRTIPELFWIISQENGFHRSVCVRENFNESSAFWGWCYMLSKIFELGDTIFIVLRKRPLIFLHWWHHITVLNAVWVTSFHFDPVARWFGIVNLGVHSLMYTYYTLKAMQIRVPKFIAMTLTTIQLGQMVWAVYLNLYAIFIKSLGQPCARSNEGIKIHFTIYFSYLILFSNYFYKAYFARKSKKE